MPVRERSKVFCGGGRRWGLVLWVLGATNCRHHPFVALTCEQPGRTARKLGYLSLCVLVSAWLRSMAGEIGLAPSRDERLLLTRSASASRAAASPAVWVLGGLMPASSAIGAASRRNAGHGRAQPRGHLGFAVPRRARSARTGNAVTVRARSGATRSCRLVGDWEWARPMPF